MAYWFYIVASVTLNVILLITVSKNSSYLNKQTLNWTEEAATKAEIVAAISCSGHGRAYLDGLVYDQSPVCECNTCYGGTDCSVLSPDCAADADDGDPLFLEQFWMQHAASSAVLIAGWHRMSYVFNDESNISPQLEIHIRKVHEIARNAITKGKYILFGVGSTQLLEAAVYALSMNLSAPASVVAAVPAYSLYKPQTEYFENKHFEYKGDASILNNSTGNTTNVIEFVTSPNNPDGRLRKSVSRGLSVSTIHDHAYYWPHYTAIPSPSNEDVMIFTISKFTGHAGSRFGWAILKDESVYIKMQDYISMAEIGISRETQLRTLQLMKTILRGNGTEIFKYAYEKMRHRWEILTETISLSNRFTLQEIPPQFCNFFEKVRGPSPAYGWLKCEREEDANCCAVLQSAKIIGRCGNLFNYDDRYVRLSILRGNDDFNLLIIRLKELLMNEGSANTM